MKKRYLLAAVLPLLMAGCAADETPEAETDLAATDSPMVQVPVADPAANGMASTVAMSPIGGGSATGEAIVTPAGEQTEVSVTLNGLEANATHPGHIHEGSCDAVGAVIVPLTPITADASGSGTMTTTVALRADTVMAGGHIVVYHDPGGTPMVCGAVEGHVM